MTRMIHSGRMKTSVPDGYMKLIRRFALRPIRNTEQYEAASEVLDELAVKSEGKLGPGEQDYFDVLTDLVEAYDRAHYPIPRDDRPPHQKLKSLLEEHGMSHADLAKVLKITRPLATLLLSGKRRITADHARVLGGHFKLDAGHFL
jgi:HTH-type transcriptional regulator / antitoxin HigA